MIFVLLFGILNKTNNKLFGGNNIKMFFNTNNNKIEIKKNYNINILMNKYNIFFYNNNKKSYYTYPYVINLDAKITYDDGSEINESKSIISLKYIKDTINIYDFIENYFKPIELVKDVIITPLVPSLSFPDEKSKDYKLFILKNNYNILLDSSIDSYGLNKIYNYVKENKDLTQKLIDKYRKYILNKYYKYIFKIPLIKDNNKLPNYYLYDEKTQLKIPIKPYTRHKKNNIDNEKTRYYYLNNNFKYLQLSCCLGINKKLSELYILDTNILFYLIIDKIKTDYSCNVVKNKCVLNIILNENETSDEQPKYIRLTTNPIDITDEVLNDYESYLKKYSMSIISEDDYEYDYESFGSVNPNELPLPVIQQNNNNSNNEFDYSNENTDDSDWLDIDRDFDIIDTNVLNPSRTTNLNVDERLTIIERNAVNVINYTNRISIPEYIEILRLLIETSNPERYPIIFWEVYYDYLEYKLLNDINQHLYTNVHYLNNINNENYIVLNNILNDYNLFPANDIRYISDTLHSIDNTNIVQQQNEDIDINTLIENYLRDFSRYDNN